MAQKTEELSDYILFFKEHLTTNDILKMALECDCSVTTIYNYLGEKMSNIHLARAIMESGKTILKEKGLNKEVDEQN